MKPSGYYTQLRLANNLPDIIQFSLNVSLISFSQKINPSQYPQLLPSISFHVTLNISVQTFTLYLYTHTRKDIHLLYTFRVSNETWKS